MKMAFFAVLISIFASTVLLNAGPLGKNKRIEQGVIARLPKDTVLGNSNVSIKIGDRGHVLTFLEPFEKPPVFMVVPHRYGPRAEVHSVDKESVRLWLGGSSAKSSFGDEKGIMFSFIAVESQ